ncbi:MAG: GH116 family glycosyl hydrolase [Anaerolineaceae bacterium]|nr:GH116 family glycosyl hydrolase [Anaerolineaceae bacterium]
MTIKASPYPKKVLYGNKPQRVFRGRNLLQIALPLGGIGAGCINLNGQGGLQDFSIRNTPATSVMADGRHLSDSAFATIYVPSRDIARLVEGPMPVERIYNQGLKGLGYINGGYEGLPRFHNCFFKGEYPFGVVQLSDPDIPLAVTVTGFNPFIPLDDKNSSIPCAILEYTFKNTSEETVEFEFSYHMSHFAHGHSGKDYDSTRNKVIPSTGVYLYNTYDENADIFGSCALGVIGPIPIIKAMWFRGEWFDGITALWKEISTGTFSANDGSLAETSRGRNGASIMMKGYLMPGEKMTYPIILTWFFPNVNYAYGDVQKPECEVKNNVEQLGGTSCEPDNFCQKSKPRWKPYYTSQWKDAEDVLIYVRDHYPILRSRTQAFHDALFCSTLPGYVLDAVSANLAILKSPTILRQSNGNLWAWEGCASDHGSCYGSCTHVWNYAQAIPHLFPALERTFREQELKYSMDEDGHVNFRSALPDGPTSHTFHPAADGQLGGIMKVYREWQISGDKDWLHEMYPLAKRSMDFCIQYWDPNHQGVLMEPHHNTYDIEFWGPDGMCTGFYLGALAAMARLAWDAACPQDVKFYEELGQKGARYLDERLFNGEYFEQEVMLKGLRASPSDEKLEALRQVNPEEYQLLIEEGPKYQYGTGCITDGVFGAWMARLCGVKSTQNEDHIRANLKAIFQYNFKASLWGHANPQRPGYAIGDEPGLLLCTWPNGRKPTLPFVYSDEVWTGIEYQAAAHMIAEGLVDEGLTIVKALRSRYDGLARNPWNEYECGNYYARAMASYGLLIALSGFRYSIPEKALYLNPRLEIDPFKVFFSTATGWGALIVKGSELIIRLEEGWLEIERLEVTLHGKTVSIEPKVRAIHGEKTVIGL